MSSKFLSIENKNSSKIGIRLKTLIEFNKITQYRLSKILNISGSYIADLNSGRIQSGGIKFWDAIRREFPGWEDYLKNKTDRPPTQIEKQLRNKTEESLIRLSILVPIKMRDDLDWEENLSDWLGVKLLDLIIWLQTDYLPEKIVNLIIERGYPPEKWLQNYHQPQEVELSFKRLAFGLGITIKPGWLKLLSEALNCSGTEITRAILHNEIPEDFISHLDSLGHAPEKWLVHSADKAKKDFSNIHNQKIALKLAGHILLSKSKYADLLTEYIVNLDKNMKQELSSSVESSDNSCTKRYP